MKIKTIENSKDFESAVRAGKQAVLFYSAWCPFCVSFMPDFEKSAETSAGTFIKISVDDAPELEDRFAVEVVPTVLFFNAGKLERRLNGVLGRGLSRADLLDFLAACGLGKPDTEKS